MKESIVSIIIPVYNRQELVKETLDSVLGQTYQNWECIVVDDGSTDDTCKILEEYAQKDSRFKIHIRNREPKGAPTCRNIGISLTQGKYVMFLDSDDLLTIDCLDYRIKKVQDNPDNSAWMFGTGVFNKEIGDTNVVWNKLNTKEDDVIRFLNQDMPWHTSGPVWLNLNLLHFNEKALSFQDWEYHLRFLILNKNYYKDLEEKLTGYYRKDNHQKSISAKTFSAIQLTNRIEVILETSKVIKSFTSKYDLDILKLIFRSTRLLKAHGLKTVAYSNWNFSKKHFNISKIDSIILSVFLLLENKNNKRMLEFVVFRIFRKGYLLNFNSTFLSCIK